MRKYILVLFCIAITPVTTAQSISHSLVEEGKVWNMLYHNDEAHLLYPDYEYRYYIKGDTLISDQNCKKLYAFNEAGNNEIKYKMALHESGGKVYFIPFGSTESLLLYDFTIQEGASAVVSEPIHPEWKIEMRNNKTQTAEADGVSRQCLYVNRVDASSEDYPSGWWIEGIGSELGPLNTWGFGAAGNHRYLLSCAVDGHEIFNMTDFSKTGLEEYFPEGTKWTEIRLDTLKYNSWYSKVGDEWRPNFEKIEYRVQGEYTDRNGDIYKCVYTDGPTWTDSLALLVRERESESTVEVNVPLFYDDDWGRQLEWPVSAEIYQFDWNVGKRLWFQDIAGANSTCYPPCGLYNYGIINEVKEGNFGGVRPLKYVNLDGKAPVDSEQPWLDYVDTNGGRIIQGIGITEWNDGECLFGPPNPYLVMTGSSGERHYRSMLVHFERGGEVLYDVWPKIERTATTTIDGLEYFLYLDSHEATITYGHTCSGEFDIPSGISYNDETFVVKSMFVHSFYNNTELTKVRIPKTIENILHSYPYDSDDEDPPTGMVSPDHMNPFRECTALEAIEVDEENPSFKSINGVLFSQDGVGHYYYLTNEYYGTGLYCYPAGRQQEVYAIPETVEWIGGDAFSRNQYLTTLSIPSSMKHICYDALSGLSKLTDVYCLAEDVPVAWNDAFKDTPIASATLHVPAGSVEKYKAASSWNQFGSIVPITETNVDNFLGAYFIITPEGQYSTLYVEPQWEKVARNEKEYTRFSGNFDDLNYVDTLLLLRQEQQKVFSYDTKTDTEHLLFDFGLRKGETYYDDIDNQEYEVTDVRDSVVAGKSLLLLELMSRDGRHDVWLEGIGSIYTGIMKACSYNRDAYLLLSGFSETSGYAHRFYPNNPYIKTADMNMEKLHWDKPIETEADWEAYQSWYEAPADVSAEFAGDTLHVWGTVRASCALCPYISCQVKENAASIVLYHCPGPDLDCISKYEIEASIPGFQRGTYEVQLFGKTAELECKGDFDPVTFTEGQMATIVLPTAPEAGKGKYYRLDRVEGNEIVFEQELQPRAHIPYIIVPSEDFCIELGTLDLKGLSRDTVSIDGVSFIGTYQKEEIESKEGFYIDLIDATPDCILSDNTLKVGALRAFLQVNWDDPYSHGGTKAPAEKMQIVLHDHGTGIEGIQSSKFKIQNEDAAIYDLSGRKSSNRKLPRGIYIKDGRKTLEK